MTAPSGNSREASRANPGALSALLEELAAAPPAAGAAARLTPGTILGRFEVLRELGSGGFGVVYEARDRELGRAVALKLVVPGRERPGARASAEAEIIARLSHPNVVTLHDVGRSEHGPYLVFELLRGETLETRLRDAALPLWESVSVALEIARGLAYAHAEGVFHRDLKPSNVFVTDDGHVKVLDFGMAHAFGRSRLSGGTPPYMAPEQWEDAPEDERTDVFALGVILYRMLSGEHPFSEDGGRWSSGTAAPPELAITGAPGLWELVARMLAKDPRARPRDGAAVVSELEPLAEALRAAGHAVAVRSDRRSGGPHSSRGEVVVRRRWLGGRARRYGIAALAGIALAAASSLAIRTFVGSRAPAAPSVTRSAAPTIAVLPFADLSEGRDQDYLSDGVAEGVLNVLSRVRGLKVIGRTSSFRFKGKEVAAPEMGRLLGVSALVEGSVRKDGDRIRVSASLVNAADGVLVWSRTYERDMRWAMALEDEIARDVARELHVEVASTATGSKATDPEAYTQYLRGVQISQAAASREEVLHAQQAFARAVAADPGFALAWARLATNFTSYFLVEQDPSLRAEQHHRAWEAASRAVALAPDAEFSYAARAQLRMAFDFDWEGARADLETALRINPSDVLSNARMGLVEGALGRMDRAIERTRYAAVAEPLRVDIQASLALFLLCAGDLAAARETARRTLELQPEFERAKTVLLVATLLGGDADAVLAAAARERDPRLRLYYTVLAEHARGNRAAADAALRQYVLQFAAANPGDAAHLHAWIGRPDEAFEWLDREWQAGRIRGNVAARWRNDPLLRGLHSDPRWQEFLLRMKLPLS